MYTYVIANISDIFDEQEPIDGYFHLVGKRSMGVTMICKKENLRLSKDETKVVLKYKKNKPSYFEGLATYTHDEILVEMAKSEWS